MKAKPISFDQLCFNAAHQLIIRRNLTQETVKQYACYWRRIKRYLLQKRIKEFNSSVGKAYLLANFGNVDYSSLRKGQKDFIRSVRVLSEFSDTGTITAVKEQMFFKGSIGEAMLTFNDHRVSLRLKKHTIEEGQLNMSRFNKYLYTNGVQALHKISASHILNFVKGMDPQHPTLRARTLEILRCFFRYAYNEGMITTDPAILVPKYKYIKQPKLPSFYSPEEIGKMIKCIDRSKPVGKRNYAVVLLAARLGLRASDIANLQFENLYWDRNLIILNQVKTGRPIELPILPKIGNAIIDYIKYGRPKSELRSVFLIANSSFSALTPCSITGIVHSCFVEAGVDISKRKHGPHALRHSLASILLEKSTMLPVITEVLGHQNTASTQFYLRIDRKSMSRCTLEVPPVNPAFYQHQKEYIYA
jgi:site-specific recombinase XerD